uniref:Acetyl-CoA acetyltransferase n=2 Tax=Meloidogyne incognita group TaxID=654580 RepID=A0A915MH09_MELJA
MIAQNLQEVFIVSAVRTPIASFRSTFSTLSSIELGSIASCAAIKRANINSDIIEEVITGSVLTAGVGQNVSRQIALKSGVPEYRNAFTVNKVCSSSLKAMHLATQSLMLGTRDVVLVVGVESMSQTPFYLARGENGYGDVKLVDGIQRDGICDALLNQPMGLCAEKTAKDYGFTREDQDNYALKSYERAEKAWTNREFAAEVVEVNVRQRKGSPDLVIKEDEEYKRLIKEKVSILAPAFLKDGTGTITAANASSLNDGAAAIVLASKIGLEQNSTLKPIAKIVAFAESGRLPIDFTIAPVDAVKLLLKQSNMSKDEIARWEVNEAFSVTALAFIQSLDLDPAKVNARGGAIALGHPIGCSGARVVVTLLHQLTAGEYGIAAICNGGGEATAVLIQKM